MVPVDPASSLTHSFTSVSTALSFRLMAKPTNVQSLAATALLPLDTKFPCVAKVSSASAMSTLRKPSVYVVNARKTKPSGKVSRSLLNMTRSEVRSSMRIQASMEKRKFNAKSLKVAYSSVPLK